MLNLNGVSFALLGAFRNNPKDLNESLLSNRGEWEAQTKAAEEELSEAEEAYRRWIPALEKKVRDLMIKLEQSEAKRQDSEESKL